MTCPNCGKELLEGEVCTCTSEQTNENVQVEPVAESAVESVDEVQPSPVYEAEPQQLEETQNTYYSPTEQFNPQGEYQNPYQEQGYNQPMYGAPQQNYYDPSQQPPYYNPVSEKPAPSTDYPENYKPKKKYVAVILGATLGGIGLHNFYLGNSTKAVAQLLIALIGSLFFGLGIIVTEIWALIETVRLLTDKIDADGNNYKIMTFAEELAKAQKKD
jgi:TM2 domain-containing membrane protein YozV